MSNCVMSYGENGGCEGTIVGKEGEPVMTHGILRIQRFTVRSFSLRFAVESGPVLVYLALGPVLVYPNWAPLGPARENVIASCENVI